MVIISLGVYRSSDGLPLSCSSDPTDNDILVSKKLVKQISQNLNRFNQRCSLYMSNRKHSIHWIRSANYNDPADTLREYRSVRSKSVTKRSRDPNISFGDTGFGIIALCQNIKKHDLEKVFFQLLSRVEQEFESRYDGFKVAKAFRDFQYLEFDNRVRKLRERFGRSDSQTRILSKEFNQDLNVKPVTQVREDEVIRLALKNERSKSNMAVMAEGSASHYLRSSHNYGSEGNSLTDSHSSSQYCGNASTPVEIGNSENQIFFPDNSPTPGFLQRILTKFNSKPRKSAAHHGPGCPYNAGLSASEYYYYETKFTEPELPAYSWAPITLILLCIALNIARAWHIATHVGENLTDDLQHFLIFIIASIVSVIQLRMCFYPLDCLMNIFGRKPLNFIMSASYMLCNFTVSDVRQVYATIFHAVCGLAIALVIQMRGIDKKSSREQA